MTEKDILIACALRFDGWRYCKATEWPEADRTRATSNLVQFLLVPTDPLQQLTVFFMLQRFLFKWGGEDLGPRSREWRAFRTLFLLTAGYEIQPRWQHGDWYTNWERDFRPRLGDCIALVAEAHSQGYDQTKMDDDLQKYHAEQYLFEVVGPKFHADGFINAFDFFSIIIWKANRAKSRIASLLLKRYPGQSLEQAVRQLTSDLHTVSDSDDDLVSVLLDREPRFRLPIASAILSVFWPERFTVYDVRACEQLKERGMPEELLKLADCNDIEKSLAGYRQYIAAVRSAISDDISLRDKDRILWARSAVAQLKKDIDANFGVHPPDPAFVKSIAASRAEIAAGNGVSHEELKRELGIPDD